MQNLAFQVFFQLFISVKLVAFQILLNKFRRSGIQILDLWLYSPEVEFPFELVILFLVISLPVQVDGHLSEGVAHYPEIWIFVRIVKLAVFEYEAQVDSKALRILIKPV